MDNEKFDSEKAAFLIFMKSMGFSQESQDYFLTLAPEQLKAALEFRKIKDEKQQDERQKKLEETAIKINEAQIIFIDKQAKALAEQGTYTRAVRSATWMTGIATGLIAIATLAQLSLQCYSKAPACEQLQNKAVQSPTPKTTQSPNLPENPPPAVVDKK
jgi:hypothetical protein